MPARKHAAPHTHKAAKAYAEVAAESCRGFAHVVPNVSEHHARNVWIHMLATHTVTAITYGLLAIAEAIERHTDRAHP